MVRITKKVTKAVAGEFKKMPQVFKKLKGAIKSISKCAFKFIKRFVFFKCET